MRRLLSTLAVLALLVAPPLSAAGLPRFEPAAVRLGDAPGNLFAWLRSLLGLQEKNGCVVDPFGRCLPEPTPKNGCRVDPDGRCLPEPGPKNGCVVDPDGRCGG